MMGVACRPFPAESITPLGYRLRSKFVKKEDLPEVRKQIKNYEKMKLLADRWIDLATELSNLRVAKEKAVPQQNLWVSSGSGSAPSL